MPGTFSPPPRVSDHDMHHGTCVTHVAWCMPGSLTSGFLWSRWREKHVCHSRRMRNPLFCVSDKRLMVNSAISISQWDQAFVNNCHTSQHPRHSQNTTAVQGDSPLCIHCKFAFTYRDSSSGNTDFTWVKTAIQLTTKISRVCRYCRKSANQSSLWCSCAVCLSLEHLSMTPRPQSQRPDWNLFQSPTMWHLWQSMVRLKK